MRRKGPDKSAELWVCADHGVMLMGDGRVDHCPSCELGVEAKPTKVPGGQVDDLEFRNLISWTAMQELVPLMRFYLADRKKGPMWVACASWPDKVLPAGYGEHERFFNILCYTFGSFHKAISNEYDARDTITKLVAAGVKPQPK